MTEVLEEVGKAVLAGSALASSREMQAPEGHTWGGKGVDALAPVHSKSSTQLFGVKGVHLPGGCWMLQGHRHTLANKPLAVHL